MCTCNCFSGVATHVLVNASDLEPPAGFSQLHLVDLFGNTLAEYPLIREDDDPNIYTLPSFVPPEIFFYVKVMLPMIIENILIW